MKMKVLLLTLILVVALSFSTIGAEYKIGAAVYGLKGEYMRLWSTALERHPAVKNGLVEITVFDGKYDASVQYSQFENMSVQGYDAIIFVPIDVEAGAAAVAVAVSNGIPVIGSNTRVNSEQLTSYIGSDDVRSGYMEAKAVVEAMGGKGKVVIIEGPIGQSAQISRREGNLKALEEYPGIEVLEMKTANWSRAEALNLMENWLNAHPGEIDGVIGQNDEMALGAIQAIKIAGFDPVDFAIAGIDGVTDAMLAVKKGELDLSILQDAKAQAQGALDLALRAIIGESYEPQADCWTDYPEFEWGETMKDIYNVPWTPITTDNIKKLMAEREELTNK
nr:substrate-binding domain-containing protein [Halocella sp. SP3-1]